MLILSRKNGQKIIINDEIEITILESKNDSCKIAINAPKDVKIYREEIYLQIKLANLIGKDTNTNAISSVDDLIKGGATLNKKPDSTESQDEIVINEEKSNKTSIRINKNAKS